MLKENSETPEKIIKESDPNRLVIENIESSRQRPGCLPDGYTLDSMLDTKQCAMWLNMTLRDFGDKYREGKVLAAKLGPKTLRFHPRSILVHTVKLAT